MAECKQDARRVNYGLTLTLLMVSQRFLGKVLPKQFTAGGGTLDLEQPVTSVNSQRLA
jgi:hypothetical protein